jgi:hypothetical protein
MIFATSAEVVSSRLGGLDETLDQGDATGGGEVQAHGQHALAAGQEQFGGLTRSELIEDAGGAGGAQAQPWPVGAAGGQQLVSGSDSGGLGGAAGEDVLDPRGADRGPGVTRPRSRAPDSAGFSVRWRPTTARLERSSSPGVPRRRAARREARRRPQW